MAFFSGVFISALFLLQRPWNIHSARISSETLLTAVKNTHSGLFHQGSKQWIAPCLGTACFRSDFSGIKSNIPRRYPEERERRAAAEHKTGGEPKVPDPRGYGGGPANGGRGQDSIAIRIRLLSRQMSCRPRGKVILKEHRIPSGVETAEHSAASSHCLHRSGGSLSRI